MAACPGYTEVHCADCGIAFQVTTDFEERRREDHEAFKCPSGHDNVWTDETKKEKQIKELEADVVRLKDRLRWSETRSARWQQHAEHEERRRTGYQGALAKSKRLRLVS